MHEQRTIPVEELELTANSLGTYIETHGELSLRTLSWLAHSELTRRGHTVSLL